ncbi:uncharacterized protein N7496_009599 [Penicillium cataractarum]|uniref:pectin lyase n=1 Tax=Penicillium cataractarum TaxID=2100454 RepID=A0A9W9RP93_9EURO|nr:uncharacterized protein N7496_009599 [Penicillium cataractarum]KAJ5363886.1 hypothetical protein N7496_009599 [Penicillium cataractarum]
MRVDFTLLFAAAAVAHDTSKRADTISITGSAPGFAYGVTGGDATPVYPANVSHLIDLLGSDEPQVVIIDRTYDFIGSEGTTTGTICKSWGEFEDGCQAIIDTGSGCGDAASESYEWDTAGVTGIYVHSNKTLIGVGSNGVLLGKGLRMVDVSNIIVQEIMITDLNPKLVWGGGRQSPDPEHQSGAQQRDPMFSEHKAIETRPAPELGHKMGEANDHPLLSNPVHPLENIEAEPNALITISNRFLNGATNFSTSCDGQTYWGLELVGNDDQITFSNNYIYRTSGRSPALSGSTLFHAVNSVWEDNNGHAIEGTDYGQGLFEGCIFNNVSQIVVEDFVGQLFSSPSDTANKACYDYLGRDCVTNIQTDDGSSFTDADTGFFSNFTGLNIASASAASAAQTSVPTNAGNTLQNALS